VEISIGWARICNKVSTHVHVLLRNIGSADLNLPIGVDAENLLATGTGREYLTVKI